LSFLVASGLPAADDGGVWIMLALLSAVGQTARDAALKVAGRDRVPLATALRASWITALILMPIALLTGDLPEGRFWIALLGSGTINAIAITLIATAVRSSDLSLVAPLLSLTPLFMLATSRIVLAEQAGAQGAAGIVVLALGTWALAAPGAGPGLLAPIRALASDRGARAMLLVALLFSVSAVLDKVGVLAANASTWAFSLHAYVALALTGVSVLRSRRTSEPAPPPRASLAPVLLAGLLAAIETLSLMVALVYQQATYVTAVKRTSTLFSVLTGSLLFREHRAGPRLAGALLMFAGFVLIVFA
jgi:uncharacterized membrane protein